MTDYPSVRGYRIVGDPVKPQRELSTAYLQLRPEASHALKKLWDEAPKKGALCLNREEEFRGDKLMTDAVAQLECVQCPVLDLCRKTAEAQHPAWGTWGGNVYGRALEEIEKRDRENG